MKKTKKNNNHKQTNKKTNQQSSNVFIWYEHVSILISHDIYLLCNQNNSLTPEWSVHKHIWVTCSPRGASIPPGTCHPAPLPRGTGAG